MKSIFILISIFLAAATSKHDQPISYWMKIKAGNKFERTVLGNMGLSVETTRDEYVYATGNWEQLDQLEKKGWVEVSFPLNPMTAKDFPTEDGEYHNYKELTQELQDLHAKYPKITYLTSIGKSVEGRDIWVLRVSGNLNQADKLPGSIFMGGHHAREHLSVDTPLRILKQLLARYEAQDARIQSLINSRDIHFIPAVNPDGLEFDVASGDYQYWRKNRSRNSDGSFGVDLNRNYGFGWGTGGSSRNPGNDTYMGPTAFSEPESRAIRDYIDATKNLTVLLTFHTFSKLILYPWGGKYEKIQTQNDFKVHEIMAQRMSQWNGYTPEQASELYLASGDTTDWAYGTHRIFSFTFECDPDENGGPGGFYPGPDVIPQVVQKNFDPVLYLIEYSDNPYRVLNSSSDPFHP